MRVLDALQLGREAAFVADGGAEALLLQHGLEGVEGLGDGAQALAEGAASPCGMIMNSWKSIGASECAPPLMTLAIGTGSTLAFGPPRYLNSGMAQRVRRGLGVGQRDGEDGVRAQLGLGFRAVELEHGAVNGQLVERVQAPERRAGSSASRSSRPW